GNFFYLSLPTGPSRSGGDIGDTPGDTSGDIPGDGPGDTLKDTLGDIRDSPGDTELILGTLEELRGKLLRLRALEAAHRQLLRSLGGGDATTPHVPSGVPSDVPKAPGRAGPPPGPQSSARGHGGTATPGTGESQGHL
ncbi:ARHGB factor, partial [Cisticola juncidis]|nr:ARHGB factor [Cisticola juncidis]